MAVRELPEVDERHCTACGDCVAVCPTDCLVLRNSLPMIVAANHCVSCSLCACICPTDAVALTAQFC